MVFLPTRRTDQPCVTLWQMPVKQYKNSYEFHRFFNSFIIFSWTFASKYHYSTIYYVIPWCVSMMTWLCTYIHDIVGHFTLQSDLWYDVRIMGFIRTLSKSIRQIQLIFWVNWLHSCVIGKISSTHATNIRCNNQTYVLLLPTPKSISDIFICMIPLYLAIGLY